MSAHPASHGDATPAAGQRPRAQALTRREGRLLLEYFLVTLTGSGHDWLEVITMPAPEPRHSGHKVRVVARQNPEWYQDFCSRYTAGRTRPRRRRKHDTLIKRKHVVWALEDLIERKGVPVTVYEHRVVDFIRRRGHKYLREVC